MAGDLREPYDGQKAAGERSICAKCGHSRRKDCDGDGWLEALGPYRDGSYISSRPCPYDNPFAAD